MFSENPELVRYISESKEENATDEPTQRLDGIVRSTKAKKDVNKRYYIPAYKLYCIQNGIHNR